MKYTIISFGKLNQIGVNDLFLEYQKRLTKYQKIEMITLEEEIYGELTKRQTTNEAELVKILTKKFQSDYKILLDIEGELITSSQIAIFLQKHEVLNSNKNIVFLIGPSDGFSSQFKQSIELKWSFGRITFPHQLFKVLLLEQLYRANTINHNEKYHK